MTEFMMSHPYITAFLVTLLICCLFGTIGSLAQRIAAVKIAKYQAEVSQYAEKSSAQDSQTCD